MFPITAVKSATILSGQSVSGAIALDGAIPLGLVLPAAWTAAALTFQGSIDGGATWTDVYDIFGSEVTVQAAANRRIVLPPSLLVGAFLLRLRSGTAAAPVAQAAGRAISVILRQFE